MGCMFKVRVTFCSVCYSLSEALLSQFTFLVWHTPCYPRSYGCVVCWYMMTSSNGNIFHVTGHLCGNFPHKGHWRGALMFSLICVWINNWVNNREAGDLRCYRTHYDVTVMYPVMYPSLCNLFENWAPVDDINGCPIFKWFAVTWLKDRASGYYNQ